MDVLTTIGILSSIGTILYLAIYIVSIRVANPRLILRISNDKEEYPIICGREGHIIFGLSTQSSEIVLLTSVCLHISHPSEIEFFTNDVFKPCPMPGNTDIALCWEGKEPIHRKYFIQFSVPFRMLQTVEGKPFTITLTATAQIESTRWKFPWSLFTPYPKTKCFTQTVKWYETPTDADNVGFLLKPGEAYRVFGKFAEEGVEARGKDVKVQVTEIFKDDSYKISDVQQEPTTKPSYGEEKV
jgi:hypothetical protein